MALSVRFSISESIGNGQRTIGNSLHSNLPIKLKSPKHLPIVYSLGGMLLIVYCQLPVAYWLLPFLRFFLFAHGIELHGRIFYFRCIYKMRETFAYLRIFYCFFPFAFIIIYQ